MELRRIPWQGTETPGENALRRHLEAEGFDVVSWRDPADRAYETHSHVCDESLWCVRGRIVFRVDGNDYALGPGDRLELPRGTLHSAHTGPEGATYLIGQRRAG
jgi:mannose-6-phosphate isomerase-like protein (cupin superfamily)